MAMYYQGISEIQADGLQTLYLMNPNYIPYSDTQNHPQPNTPFFNPQHAPISAVAPHAPPSQQFMGIPLSHDPSRPSPSQEDNAIPRFHYNIWGLVDHHQSAYGNLNQPNTPQQQQTLPKGLCLSLTHHQTGFDKSNIPSGDDHDHDFPGQIIISPKNCSSPNLTTTSAHRTANYNTVQSVIMGSEYLKAAKELLDEVVSVGKGRRDKAKIIKESVRTYVGKSSGGGENGNKNGGVELTTAQRQEIQMKKAKLNSMLDEVEQRYKQYHYQMQIIVTSFEQIAGTASAKSYTHLALRTILKQFRCLKNTISAQIKALSKSLGEEENSGEKMEGSRLKFVDHHLRQQRTLQQLGLMQSNAWRPQRGLPERAVSVLRAWLFENFLHPYPKDSDKHMLAKQTGLTKSQVSNWFINARVRLWKPMVEDMYLEEIKNQEISPDDDNNTTKPDRESSNSKPTNPRQANNNITNTPQSMQNNKPTLNPTRKNMQQNRPEKNPKKPRKNNNSPITKPGEYHDQTINKGFDNNITFIGTNYLGQTRENYLSSSSGFSSTYGISDRQQITSSGGFQGNSNNFSLTLGLPHSETYSQQEFFPHRSFEFGTRIEPVEGDNRVNLHPNIGNYEILDFQNRDPFPPQLLHHHFVASQIL